VLTTLPGSLHDSEMAVSRLRVQHSIVKLVRHTVQPAIDVLIDFICICRQMVWLRSANMKEVCMEQRATSRCSSRAMPTKQASLAPQLLQLFFGFQFLHCC